MAGKDFAKTTIGTGVLKINDVDVGYLDDVKLRLETEILEKFYGSPAVRAGFYPIKSSFELEAIIAQVLDAENLKYVLGGLEPVVIAGTEVDKTTSFETLTANKTSGNLRTLYHAKMGPTNSMNEWVTISDDGDAPVVKNVAETTTYTENDDYMVDYATGYVVWNPGGTHWATFTGDSYAAKYKYKYTPAASKRIDLGKTYTQQTYTLEFKHTNPVDTSATITVYMHKASAKPSIEWEFNDSDTLNLTPVFFANDDSNTHPDNPYGYILIT